MMSVTQIVSGKRTLLCVFHCHVSTGILYNFAWVILNLPNIKLYVILVSNIHGSYMIVGAGAGAKRYPKVVGNYKLQLFDDTCEGNDPVLIYKHVERDIFLQCN